METPLGKRMPVYFISIFLIFPCFYLTFNPPTFAIGKDPLNPVPYIPFFFIIPTLMNIGQGGMQLSHLSLLNSITYDQRRRDKLINYRNSCAYAAGIVVPAISFFSFTYFSDEFVQYKIISNFCLVLGIITTIFFLWKIDEIKLVKESKSRYDAFFMIKADSINDVGFIDYD